MPRLLQALAGAPQGGAEKHFLRLCLALQRAGVDQRVVIRPPPQSLAVLRAGGIAPVTAPFGGLFDCQTGAILRRESDRIRPHPPPPHLSPPPPPLRKGAFLPVARPGGPPNT